jgi:hypothetical protein
MPIFTGVHNPVADAKCALQQSRHRAGGDEQILVLFYAALAVVSQAAQTAVVFGVRVKPGTPPAPLFKTGFLHSLL